MKVEQRLQLVDGPLAGLALSATFEIGTDGEWCVRLYCTGPVEGSVDQLGDSPQWWATYVSQGQHFEDTILRVNDGAGWSEDCSLLNRPSMSEDRSS